MFDIFCKEIVDTLRDFYGNDAEVLTTEVLKNNGKKMTGLTIKIADETSNLVPMIYLDDIYEKYDAGMDLDTCVEKIVELRKNCMVGGNKDEASRFANAIMDTEFVRTRVYPTLINAEENKELLGTLAHTHFLDLAVIYQVRGFFTDEGYGSVKITNELLNQYNIDIEILNQWAMQNLKKDGYELKDIRTVLAEMVELPELDCDEDFYPEGKMLVLSNSNKIYGAAALLDQDYLKEKLGRKNHYILPSSVHELILVPQTDDIYTNELTEMVREVNESQVEFVDRLADHIYFYDGESQSVQLCA